MLVDDVGGVLGPETLEEEIGALLEKPEFFANFGTMLLRLNNGLVNLRICFRIHATRTIIFGLSGSECSRT